MEMEEDAAGESTGDMHCFIGRKQMYLMHHLFKL